MKFGFCNKMCYLLEFIFLPFIYDGILMALYELVNNEHVTVYSYEIPDVDLYLLLWINFFLTTFVMVPSYVHQAAVIYYGGKRFRTTRFAHIVVYIFHAILYAMLFYLCIIDFWNGFMICVLIALCIVCIAMRERVDDEELELPR
jgi:hypothetical protein